MNKLIFFFSLCFLSACITETDLSGDTKGLDRLVVDGSFNDRESAQQIRLWHPNRYGLSKFDAVENAEIKIFDDQGNSAVYEPKIVLTDVPFSRDYFYELPVGPFKGIPGRSYYIEISLADGRKYKSEPQIMPRRVSVDSLSIYGKKVVETNSSGTLREQKKAFVEASMVIPEEGGDYWLRYEAHSVGFFTELPPVGPFDPQRECYLTDNFTSQKVVAQAVKNGNGKTIKVMIGAKNIDYHFERSIYFTVIQHSVTRRAFDFWEAATAVANPQGSVFDTPPGAIKSNISSTNTPNDIPLGYFEVSAVDTIRKRLYNGDLGEGYFVNPLCFYVEYNVPNLVPCRDCIRFPNSTYRKPHYWEE